MALKHRNKNPLLGKANSELLRKAAGEIRRVVEFDRRRHEVDSREHRYDERKREYACIEEKLSDGRWRLYTVEDICGQGTVDVVREDRENLMPAAKNELWRKMVRGGQFNEPAEAIDYVCEQCELWIADSFTGKVTG